MNGTSAPSPLPRMAATINLPGPALWTVLEGDANTPDYDWRQPQYHAIVTGVALAITFTGSLKPWSDFWLLFLIRRSLRRGIGATCRLLAEEI
jgi:hypothetical protein